MDPELIRLELGENAIEVCLVDLARLADLASTATRFLTAPELAEYAELRLPSRRREWLGARAGLKLMAVRDGAIGDPLGCAVVKDARGRPRLVHAPPLGAAVVEDCSISHKGRFACAAISRVAGVAIGVDIEEVSARLAGLARAFVHGRDALLGARPELERLAILWALKEACAKVTGRGIAIGLREVICEETAPGRHRVLVAGAELTGRHALHEGYVVALCRGAAEVREG